MGTILRANLITVTTLDKWKAVFVNSNSLPLYNETQRGWRTSEVWQDVKKALVKAVYYVMEYPICILGCSFSRWRFLWPDSAETCTVRAHSDVRPETDHKAEETAEV